MNSKIAPAGLAFFLSAILFSGCTEKLPLTPVYSSTTDWTPQISIDQNGYQRVEILIDRPTRKELWRNISSLTLQARTSTTPVYYDIDTLAGSYAAPTQSYGRVVPIYFQSKPRLDYSTDYSFRVAAHFGTGERNFSNELAVRTPPGVGKILKQIRQSDGNFDPPFFFLSFHRGSLLALEFQEIARIDTATGQRVSLKLNFSPPYDRSQYFLAFTVAGDTAYSYYRSGDDYFTQRLVALDLTTLRVDSTKTISTPGKTLATIVAHRGELYGFWWTSSGNQQAGIINPHTGEVTSWFSETPSFIGMPSDISSNGTSIFYCRDASFDNRIVALDQLTMNPANENRNPVFSSTGLAWDGANFWVVDIETRSYTKIKLEGM